MPLNHSSIGITEKYLYKPGPDVMHLFWSSVSRRVAQAFIFLFSSVYVYETFVRFGASNKTAMILVAGFFIFTLSSKLVFLIIAENISRKTGFKGMIWLSAMPFAIYVPSLIFASGHPGYFLIAAISYGAYSAFYWWGFHGYFIKVGDRKHFGEGVGEVEFLNTFATIITPLVGGIIIEVSGFTVGYVIAGLFVFLSLLLLGKDRDRRQNTDIYFKDVLKLAIKHKSMTLAYIGGSMEGIFYVFGWPLFLFLFFGGVVKLGAFVTISALLAAVVGIFAGKKVDEQGERGVVAIAAPALSFSWFLKAVTTLVPIYVIAESIRNFGERILIVSLVELSYKKAVEALTARAILFREFAIIIGSLLSLTLFVFWVLLGFGFQSFFVVVGLGSLLPLIAVYKQRI